MLFSLIACAMLRYLQRNFGRSKINSNMSLLEKLGFARRQHASLVILDDIFPHLLSAFRIAEFNAYLSRYPNSLAYSTGLAFPAVGEYRSFEEVRAEYLTAYPEFQGRVHPYSRKIARA